MRYIISKVLVKRMRYFNDLLLIDFLVNTQHPCRHRFQTHSPGVDVLDNADILPLGGVADILGPD